MYESTKSVREVSQAPSRILRVKTANRRGELEKRYNCLIVLWSMYERTKSVREVSQAPSRILGVKTTNRKNWYGDACPIKVGWIGYGIVLFVGNI